MIKKWKVTPVSTKGKPPVRPDSRSKDDAAAPNRTTEVIQVKSRKPRRHTTGDTKQTLEDIRLAKTLVDSMNGHDVPPDGNTDPNSTLGRKQLISMLKQRYGNEMDAFRTSGEVSEKERIRKERQRERDLRHNQRMTQENREMHHHGGVHHSPAMNGNREHFSGTGSEGSDDSLHVGTGNQRRYVTHTKTTKHRIVGRSDSEDDGSREESEERLLPADLNNQINNENVIRSKGVVFLQYLDDVKRVNLPATVTSIDTLKALFVTSFPDRIAMQDFEDQVKVVYIKDVDTGTYYMLEDVTEVLNRSFLKIHEKSPSVQSNSSETLETRKETPQSPRSIPSEYSQSLEDFHLIPPRPVPTLNGSTHVQSANLPAQSTPINNSRTYNDAPQHQTTQSSTSHIHIKSSGSHIHIQDGDGRVQNGVDSQQSHPVQVPIYTETKTASSPSVSTANSSHDTKTRSHSHNPYDSHLTPNDARIPLMKAKSESYTNDVRIPVMKSKSESYTCPQSGESVEDQLDDLTELLKSALDEEEQHHAEIMECVNTKNPGKLDPNLLEKIQSETQTLARKNTLPKYFQPTIMVAAQQESDRRTSERSNSESSNEPPPRVAEKPKKNVTKTTSVKMKINKHVPHDEHERTDVNNNTYNTTDTKRNSRNATEQRNSRNATELIITPPHEKRFSYNNVDTYESVDGTRSNVRVEEPHCHTADVSTLEKDVDTSNMSDALMEQIMDMEQEVNARSTLSIRSGHRSSTGSSCQSSIAEKLNTTCEDTTKIEQPPPIENQHSNTNDIYIKDNLKSTSIIEEETTVNGNHTFDEDRVFLENNTNSNSNLNGPTSMQHVYASISKVTALPTSSKVTRTVSSTKRMSGKQGTGEAACHHASVTTPDFIELEDSARNVHATLHQLRKDLSDLRKCHVDGVRTFKADIQKKLLEFRKKAARVDDILQQKLDVNNNIIFANEHPVRERRHRLTGDQLAYNKKMSDTELRLKFLEGDMERIRISVVNKKRVENPQNLKELHEELTQLTKGLAEIKNRFHGLHDMLKIVMPDEMKIISGEERFLKDEPQKLEALIGRCKVLSGTLFTLERLASVQLEQGDAQQQPQQTQHSPPSLQTQQSLPTQQSQSVTSPTTRNSHYNNYSQSSTTTAANYNYHQSAQIDNVFDIEDLKGKRSVRFSNKN